MGMQIRANVTIGVDNGNAVASASKSVVFDGFREYGHALDFGRTLMTNAGATGIVPECVFQIDNIAGENVETILYTFTHLDNYRPFKADFLAEIVRLTPTIPLKS